MEELVVDLGEREQDAYMEGIRFAINIINKLDIYCEKCKMEADALCRINHPQKCFLYYQDFEKCLKKLKGATKDGR